MLMLIEVPSNCCAFDSASPSRVFVASLIIDAVRLASPRRDGDSIWLAPPWIVIRNATKGRSRFSDTIKSAPFVSVYRIHTGTCSTGGFAGGGILDRSTDCCATAARPANARVTVAVTKATARRVRDF